MSGIRSITRRPAAIGYATAGSAPLRVDSSDNKVKVIPAGSGTTELELLAGYAPVNVAAATITLTRALHANRVITLNLAAGIAVTLPPALGTGDWYTLVVGTTFTGAASIAVPNATDYMVGTALLFADGGDTTVGFATANTGTVASESDTISLFGTANAQGGIKGEIIELCDIGAAQWAVRLVSDAGGTEATPFSAGV